MISLPRLFRRRPARRPSPARRLTLELLEDRSVPAGLAGGRLSPGLDLFFDRLADCRPAPAAAAAATPAVPAADAVAGTAAHDPVLFVHGWRGNRTTWTTMIGRFGGDGWASGELYNWAYDFNQSNALTARQLAGKVNRILAATGASQVDIVTHSMGALPARYYVRYLGGAAKVDALVSLGGPNHGTTTAFLVNSVAGMQMRPNSAFLQGLNRDDETPGDVRYATWWTPCDNVVIPAATSTPLDGATNTQTVCMSHSALHEDAGVYGEVRDFVSQ